MISHAKALVVGMGDLGRRIALQLAGRPQIGSVTVAGRDLPSCAAFARLASACSRRPVLVTYCDVLDVEATVALLQSVRPDVVVQCASLLSPWSGASRPSPVLAALQAAGFGVQLAAQLPAVSALMQAVRLAGMEVPVVNCSYPDVTNAILARNGVAPTLGVGNCGMIAALVEGSCRDACPGEGVVRVLAHHSQVRAVMLADRGLLRDTPPPRIYVGDSRWPSDVLFEGVVGIPPSREWNALTASHAVEIVVALVAEEGTFETSAPGPNGIEGGWPVRIQRGRVTLDLPPSTSMSDALQFQRECARLDGIAAIADDGTVEYTAAAAEALAPWQPRLCEPLPLGRALERFGMLRQLIAEHA